jgi:hypothetical protein|tara:strand:- start:120 stop:332 length:213 start_codon:yes stop_codon:yes gene_type:complete
MAEFVFKLANNEMVTFADWDDIPEDFIFKHLIKFLPDEIPEEHSEEEHEIATMWNQRLQQLMERERAGNM